MMTLLEIFIRAVSLGQDDVRITCENRWLVFDDTTQEFVVYEKIPYKRNTYVVCRTLSSEYAIESLLEK